MKPNRYLIVGIVLLLVGAIIYYLADIVSFILIAWVVSILGRPLMVFFMKRLRIWKFRAGPSFCALLTLLCFIFTFVLVFSIFVPLVVEQANNLSSIDYNALAHTLEEPFNQVNHWAQEWGFVTQGQTATQQLHQLLNEWFKPSSIGSFFGSFVSAAGGVLVGITSVMFIAFFFLKDNRMFLAFLLALVPNEYEKKVRYAVDDVSRLLTRYFSGILLQLLYVTVFISISLTILGINNALLIGIFAALMNVIPYVGPWIAGSFGVLVTVSGHLGLDFHTQMIPLILKVVAVFAAMQTLDNFIVQPLIFSNRVNAHPLEIFIVILIAAKVGGIGGMVLAIPVYTALRVIARSFLSEFKVVQKLTEGL